MHDRGAERGEPAGIRPDRSCERYDGRDEEQHW
jgi:hypothetical protein